MELKSHRIAIGALALMVGLLVTAAWAGWPHHTTRPMPQHGIPNRDYDYPQFSKPAFALSRPASLLVTDPTPTTLAATPATAGALSTAPKVELKLFQLDTPRLRIDHCELSRFSLVIDEHGNWLLNAMGEQGVQEAPAAGDKMAERPLAVLPLRNLFRVCVRGHPATSAVASPELDALGRPVLFQLPAQAFWVQRGKTRFLRVSGSCDELKPVFDLIDRVELEFAYR